MTTGEFWEQTPAETAATLEAAVWREGRQRERDLALAWHVAMLERQKRLPTLQRLLHPPESRPLKGAEREKRRKEFEELKERMGGGSASR